MILQIQNILLHDEYQPMRRAATLVLTDLLRGMQRLEDFQEMLTPIYRILKNIAENDQDLHIQIHARDGLECLREKISEALNKEIIMEKEIRICDMKTADKFIRYK